MPKETKLEEVLHCTLESLKEKDYSIETLLRYQGKVHVLTSIAQKKRISEPIEELYQEYLGNNKNKYTGEHSALKERERIRVINLIRSYIANGEVDTSRKKGKSASDRIQTESFRNELTSFVMTLKKICLNLILYVLTGESLHIY